MLTRLLIFEDDAVTATFLEAVLSRNGFNVTGIRQSADDALQDVSDCQPDLVLMDIQLAGEKSGIEAADALRHAGVPFIFLTAHSDSAVFEQARGLNPAGFLFKPVTANQLIATIDLALSALKASRTLSESEHRIRALFDAYTAGTLLLSDPDLIIQDANRAALAVTGLDTAHLIGKPVAGVFALSDLRGYPSEGDVHFENFRRPDGSSLTLSLTFLSRIPHNGTNLWQVEIRDLSAEQASQEQLNILTAAVNQAADAILITDANLEAPGPFIEFANPAFERMSGYSRLELLGKSPRVLQGPASNRAMLLDLKQKLQLGLPFQGETTNYRKDGSSYEVEWSITPIKDTRGTVTHFISVQRDVTEERRIQRTLIDQEAYLRSVFDSSPSAFFLIDPEFRILVFNREAQERARQVFKREPKPGEDMRLYSVPALTPSFEENVRKAASGQFIQKELRIPYQEELSIWYRVTYAPAYRSDGSILGVAFTAQNISAEKAAAEAIQESEERFRSLADASPIMIWISDKSGGMVYVNRSLEQFSGQEMQTGNTPRWPVRVHPDDAAAIDDRIQEAYRKRTPIDLEYRMKRADGAWRWVNNRASPRFSSMGNFEGFTGSLTDITYLKETADAAEQQKQALTDTLNAIKCGVVKFGNDGRIEYINDTAIIDPSLSREMLLGMHFAELWNGAADETGPIEISDSPIAQALFQRRVVVNRPVRYIQMDGRDIWMSMSAVPHTARDGRPDGALVSFIDISALREARSLAIEQERRFEQTLQSMVAGVVRVNMSGEITFGNTAAATILDVVEGPVEGKFFQSRQWNQLDLNLKPLPPERLPLARALAHGEFVINMVHAIQGEGGELKWLSVNAAPIFNEQGRMDGAVASFIDITEQFVREQQILESEQRFRAMADTAPIMITQTGSDGTMDYMNRAWTDFLGIPEGHPLAGDQLVHVVHPDDIEGLFDRTAKGIQSQSGFSTEIRMKRRDGEFRWIHTRVVPRSLPDGSFAGFIAISTDVTDQREAEMALRDANAFLEKKIKERTAALEEANRRLRLEIEQRALAEKERIEIQRQFQLASDNMSEALFRSDLSRVVWCNRATLALFGLDSLAELQALGNDAFWSNPDDRRNGVQELQESGRIDNREVYLKRKNGELFTALMSAVINKDPETGAPFLIGTIRDISELTRARNELRRKEADLSRAQQLASVGNWVLELTGGSPLWHPENYRQYGMDQIHPMPYSSDFERSIAPADRRKFDQAVDTALLGGQGAFDIRVEQEGQPRYIHGIIQMAAGHDGKPASLLGVARDRTTEHLAEIEIDAARARAEDLARTKQQFLANMSHEIRTPINGIRGMAYLLAQSSLDTDQRSFVQAIQTSSDSLLGIINDILDISKIESGRIVFERSAFSLGGVLQTVVQVIAIKARDKKLPLKVTVAPGVPDRLNGDPLRLGQILTNLLDNAVKFTEKGQVAINIHPNGHREDRISLQFSIADTGIGIPKDRLDTIFDLFTQSDPSITRKYGGSGLGLTITRKLIENQGGTIRVDSEPGMGTTFTFELTFGVEEHQGEAVAPVETRPLTGFPGHRVLVVDDNSVNRMWVARMITQWGCTVAEAQNGVEAVKAASSEAFDLVLMDLYMPEMDGYEASRKIRSLTDPARAQVPIIALTADVLDNQAERCERAGMNGWLGKPFTPEALHEIMKRHMAVSAVFSGPSESLQNPSELSLQKLKEAAAGDVAFITHILNDFLLINEETIAGLRRSLNDGDGESFRRLIHRLKPNLDYVGAAGLLELVTALLNRFKKEPEFRISDAPEAAAALVDGLSVLQESVRITLNALQPK